MSTLQAFGGDDIVFGDDVLECKAANDKIRRLAA